MPEGAVTWKAQSCYMACIAANGRTCRDVTGEAPLIARALFTGYWKDRSFHMSVGASSKLAAFWNHPAGPKTIHFWAPTFKCEIHHTLSSLYARSYLDADASAAAAFIVN